MRNETIGLYRLRACYGARHLFRAQGYAFAGANGYAGARRQHGACPYADGGSSQLKASGGRVRVADLSQGKADFIM